MFKQKVYSACLDLLREKISSLQKTLLELEEGSENDSKSSAGDKHETARAMMQIEQEKIFRQLKEALSQLSDLEKTDVASVHTTVAKGSLIKTNNGVLFLCVALGKITVEGEPVIALSPESPLGAKLPGLKINCAAEINGLKYIVEDLS